MCSDSGAEWAIAEWAIHLSNLNEAAHERRTTEYRGKPTYRCYALDGLRRGGCHAAGLPVGRGWCQSALTTAAMAVPGTRTVRTKMFCCRSGALQPSSQLPPCVPVYTKMRCCRSGALQPSSMLPPCVPVYSASMQTKYSTAEHRHGVVGQGGERPTCAGTLLDFSRPLLLHERYVSRRRTKSKGRWLFEGSVGVPAVHA